MRQQPFISPEEALEHFGIKGMRWGVRNEKPPKEKLIGYVKEPIVRTTKNGDTVTMTPYVPKPARLAGLTKGMTKNYNKTVSYVEIADKHGTKIGKASFVVRKKEIHLGLIQIEKSARGQGYATEILKAAAEHGKANGMNRMILDVPFDAPDARHIYEKMGFKAIKGQSADEALTEMEYRFDEN